MAANRQAGISVLAMCIILLLAIQLFASRSYSAFAGPRHRFARGRKDPTSRTRLLSSTCPLSWLELAEGQTSVPNADAQVMPVIPLRTIEWPGTSCEIKVIDPAFRKMYDDLLSSGKRYIVAPFSCLPMKGSRTDAEVCAGKRRLFSIGSVLMLEDLKDVSDQSDGAIKYLAKHSVVGRAKIKRLLNPSDLSMFDESNDRENYLEAEVEVLPDSQMEVVNTSWVKQTVDSWEELRALSEVLEEPRLESKPVIKQNMMRSTSYQLAGLWQKWQVQSAIYRQKSRVHTALRSFIKGEQQQGRLPDPLPSQLNLQAIGTPTDLIEAYTELTTRTVTLPEDFWGPLLSILADDDSDERRHKLLKLAENELKITRARSSLRNMLG